MSGDPTYASTSPVAFSITITAAAVAFFDASAATVRCASTSASRWSPRSIVSVIDRVLFRSGSMPPIAPAITARTRCGAPCPEAEGAIVIGSRLALAASLAATKPASAMRSSTRSRRRWRRVVPLLGS